MESFLYVKVFIYINNKLWKKIIPEKTSIYITIQLCFPLGKKKYIFSDTNLEVNQFLQGNLEASVDMPYKIMD